MSDTSTKKTRRFHVRWQDADFEKLIPAYHEFKMKGFNNHDSLRRAQAVLPPTKRVVDVTSGRVSKFNDRYKAAVNKGPIPKPVFPESFPATPAPVPAAADTSTAPEIYIIERKVVVKEYPDYGKIPTSTLARLLLERLANLEEAEAHLAGLTKALEQKRKVEAAYDRSIDPSPPEQQPRDETRTRIAIIGLLPGQCREIEQRTASIAHKLKLKFHDADNGGEKLSDYLDYIIVTKHCNHGWWEKAKANYPADCVFFVDGAVQGVTQKIYDLVSRQTPHQNGNGIPKALTTV